MQLRAGEAPCLLAATAQATRWTSSTFQWDLPCCLAATFFSATGSAARLTVLNLMRLRAVKPSRPSPAWSDAHSGAEQTSVEQDAD